MKRNSTFSGHFALTGVAAAAMCLAAPAAWSLGLGRLQVQSALGEALRAEIEITSLTPEEAANLKVRVAPPDAYRAAGVDYNVVLPGTKTELMRRADGTPYLRLVSDRGVQEPFVDLILEINWSTGRLVREYTLLVDPPVATRTPSPSSTVTAAATSPVITAAPPAATSLPTPALAGTGRRGSAPRSSDTTTTAAAPATAPAPRPAGIEGDEYKVRPGDSLSRIAGQTQRSGVSLDQMLVALYRANPQAFSGNNMNRLRAGVVLSVPTAETANSVTTAEARQVIHAQSADFGAYRQTLASGVSTVPDQGSKRSASGSVQATVDDRKRATTTTPDRLEMTKGKGAGSAAEQRIADAAEKKAAAERQAELDRNLRDIKKAQELARTAAATAPAPLPAPSPATKPGVVTPPAAAPAPTPVAVVTPPPTPVVTAPVPVPAPAPIPAPAPATTVAMATPPITDSAASATSGIIPLVVVASAPTIVPPPVIAAASAPAIIPPPKPAVKPRTPPAAEQGMLGSLLDDNPILVGAGALVIALLAGFGFYRFSKRPKKDSGETSFLESRLQPDSFFGASGGQRIDTRDAGGTSSSMSYSLSQLDAIGDVDPVAEADVYLAYGRDLQAEEILKEAMRSSPERMAIRTKLLEVYAKRRDTKGFELLATQLFALTRGEGEDWAKAQELGAQIDPDNPLFKPGGAPDVAHGAGGEMIEPLGASTMPQSVLPTPSKFGAQFGGAAAARDDSLGMESLNPKNPMLDSAGMDLDLDLDNPEVGLSTSPGPLETTQAFTPASSPAKDDLSLDFSVPEVPKLQTAAAPAVSEPSAFDLSEISLDLDMPAERTAAGGRPPAADSGFGEMGLPSLDEEGSALDPMSRKLELAEEFRQIGDNDGARDLLHEVVAKSTGATKTRAQSMLAALG